MKRNKFVLVTYIIILISTFYYLDADLRAQEEGQEAKIHYQTITKGCSISTKSADLKKALEKNKLNILKQINADLRKMEEEGARAQTKVVKAYREDSEKSTFSVLVHLNAQAKGWITIRYVTGGDDCAICTEEGKKRCDPTNKPGGGATCERRTSGRLCWYYWNCSDPCTPTCENGTCTGNDCTNPSGSNNSLICDGLSKRKQCCNGKWTKYLPCSFGTACIDGECVPIF